MPQRKSQPKFRFWLGGPRAYVGLDYWVVKKKYMGGGYYYMGGCSLVKSNGFEIPGDTYYNADMRVSQYLYPPQLLESFEYGYNRTALLPLEVDE